MSTSTKNLPVAVVQHKPRSLEVLQRFATVSGAEAYIANRLPRDAVERGEYSIDAPETMVNPPPDEVWKTKDGREIKVGDMHEEHVRNALRLVLRRRRQGLANPRLKAAVLAVLQELADDQATADEALHHSIVDEDWDFKQP